MSTPASTTTQRPDMDIEADLQELLVLYPPLAHDRHRLRYTVQDGHITIAGHVLSRVTHHYLVNNLPLLDGVQSVDTSQLYQDEDIRIDIGRLMPFGIFVNVEYGTVKLTGKLPPDTTVEGLVNQAMTVPGVERVVTALQ
jgi:hypothetical protein